MFSSNNKTLDFQPSFRYNTYKRVLRDDTVNEVEQDTFSPFIFAFNLHFSFTLKVNRYNLDGALRVCTFYILAQGMPCHSVLIYTHPQYIHPHPHTHTPLLTPTLLFTHYPVWGNNSIPETQSGFSYKSLLCQVNC